MAGAVSSSGLVLIDADRERCCFTRRNVASRPCCPCPIAGSLSSSWTVNVSQWILVRVGPFVRRRTLPSVKVVLAVPEIAPFAVTGVGRDEPVGEVEADPIMPPRRRSRSRRPFRRHVWPTSSLTSMLTVSPEQPVGARERNALAWCVVRLVAGDGRRAARGGDGEVLGSLVSVVVVSVVPVSVRRRRVACTSSPSTWCRSTSDRCRFRLRHSRGLRTRREAPRRPRLRKRSVPQRRSLRVPTVPRKRCRPREAAVRPAFISPNPLGCVPQRRRPHAAQLTFMPLVTKSTTCRS